LHASRGGSIESSPLRQQGSSAFAADIQSTVTGLLFRGATTRAPDAQPVDS
jgi:hypothetical protein